MSKFFLVLFFLLSFSLSAQKQLEVNIEKAEKLFIENNLLLLSEKYNIDLAKAELIQAKLFENPTINIERALYSREDKKYFEGHNLVELEQLILLAGKRNKAVKLERINVEIAEFQFQEVLRTLKNSLYLRLFDISYAQKSILVFQKEIDYLKRLLDVYNSQYAKGNISLIEKSRLEALLFNLYNEKLEIEHNLVDAQKELKLLLNVEPETEIKVLIENVNIFDFNLPLYEELSKDIDNRAILRMSESEIKAKEANLKLQKSMRIPDVTIKGTYDIESNFIGLGLNFGLPLFNRNQGGIKSAVAQHERAKILHQHQLKEVNMQLYANYEKAIKALSFYKSFDINLEKNFSKLIDGVTSSFEKRTISILEFIDYYETYKETCLQIYNTEKLILTAIEDLNFVTGTDKIKIIKPL